MWHKILFAILIVAQSPLSDSHLLPGLYCGREDCYDVVNATRTSTKSEISKNYRLLARKFHPDNRDTGDEEQFKRVANAYEILKDDDARKDYDYMLDNPEAYYQNYYRYYSRKGPKVDIRLVILLTISVISIMQYYVRKTRYEEAVNYFVTVPKYRNKALEMLTSEKPSHDVKKDAKKSKLSKAELKEQQEKQIRQIIQENMDIKGAYSKPSIVDILWVQIIILPYTFFKYVSWYVLWTINFTFLKKEYGEEEQLYLIRKNLGLGVHQFNAIEDDVIDDYLRQELWIKDNFKEWKAEQDEVMKTKMADNNRHKSYRRYMKNNKSRMTFMED